MWFQNTYSLFRENYRYIIYALSHSFSSSYGQTIFLSLFAPFIQKEFSLLDSEFGELYAIATFASALFLPIPGKLIDTMLLRKYSFMVLCGLSISICIIIFSFSIIGLVIGIFGVRFFAQSLMSHISSTSISRMLSHERGRALSLAGLGHSLGEAFLPLILVLLMNYFNWRVTWFLMLLPLFIYMSWVIWGRLIKENDIFLDPHRLHKANLKKHHLDLSSKSSFEGITGRHWTRKEVLTNDFFYWIIPLSLSTPFILTGFLFYQVKLVEYKEWSLEIFASGFTLFALFRIIAALFTGFLIDRFTAFRIFMYSTMSLFLSILLLYCSSSQIISFFFLAGAGLSVGISTNMKSALLSEVYGTKFLGSIKSLYATLIVFSTGAATWLFGLALTKGITFDQIMIGALCFLFIATFFAWVARMRMELLCANKLR